jgi:membrane-bound ClpP family serine protease
MMEKDREATESIPTRSESEPGQRRTLMYIGIAVVVIVLLVLAVLAVLFMVSNPAQTETYRDIVIIFMALEALVLGIALIVLILQLARLTALIQNEIKPILESTQETVSTLRGTTTFLSNNVVSPVIKAGSSLAAARRALDLLRFGRPK